MRDFYYCVSMFFHIFSPTKILEKSVVGGVTLNHLTWASLFGGNFLPVQNRLGQGKEGSLFAFACNAKRFAVAFVFFSYFSCQFFLDGLT